LTPHVLNGEIRVETERHPFLTCGFCELDAIRTRDRRAGERTGTTAVTRFGTRSLSATGYGLKAHNNQRTLAWVSVHDVTDVQPALLSRVLMASSSQKPQVRKGCLSVSTRISPFSTCGVKREMDVPPLGQMNLNTLPYRVMARK
jgi:hypothetical protein